MPAGRPTSLTPEVQAIIIEAMEDGNYLEIAAAAAGVTRQSIYNWQKRGEQGDTPYVEFFVALKRAEARAEIALLKAVRTAEGGVVGEHGAVPWQSRAWVLERRWPERWGGRIRQTVTEERETLLTKLKANPELHQKVSDVLRGSDPQESAAPTPH